MQISESVFKVSIQVFFNMSSSFYVFTKKLVSKHQLAVRVVDQPGVDRVEHLLLQQAVDAGAPLAVLGRRAYQATFNFKVQIRVAFDPTRKYFEMCLQ